MQINILNVFNLNKLEKRNKLLGIDFGMNNFYKNLETH